MTSSLWISLTYGLVAAFANLAGAWTVAHGARRDRGTRILSVRAAGAGFLAAVVLVDAVPASFRAWAEHWWVAVLLVAAGYAALHVLERVARAHVHGRDCDHDHDQGPALSRSVAWTGVAGLAAHTLLDGAAVAAATAAGGVSGALVAAGLVLHQGPVGASAGALAIAGGGTPREARNAGAILAAASLIGAAAFAVAARLSPYALPLMAGITTHVVVHDLAPTLRSQGRLRTIALATAGAAVFAASEALVRFAGAH